MSLDWLGQLSPTMQQQIALQRALLALQREDEQIRMRTMPQAEPATRRGAEQPALARRLGAGPGPAIPGGPTYKPQPPSPLAAGRGAEPRARGLEGALTAGAPVTGRPDWQAEAWARREEMAEERVIGAKEAFDRISTLDPEGQKVALNALRRYKREVYNAMKKEGYLSPTGVLVEPKKKVVFRDTRITGGWEYEDITYEDGTTETRTLGPAPEEVAEAPTIPELVSLEKLGMDVKKFEERHLTRAIDTMGAMPRAGIDTITVEGKEKLATAEDEKQWRQGVETLAGYYQSLSGEAPGAEVPLSIDEIKTMYEGRPDLISDIQQQLGLTVTGVWDDTLDEAFKTYGGVE